MYTCFLPNIRSIAGLCTCPPPSIVFYHLSLFSHSLLFLCFFLLSFLHILVRVIVIRNCQIVCSCWLCISSFPVTSLKFFFLSSDVVLISTFYLKHLFLLFTPGMTWLNSVSSYIFNRGFFFSFKCNFCSM
jgi:hypothetical protein